MEKVQLTESTPDPEPVEPADVLATFSKCRRYRYWLRRIVDEFNAVYRPCVWIMLNPSTADETNNDATTRRCIGFARQWGYTDHIAVNLFALRSPNPADLRTVDDPIGEHNDFYLDYACHLAMRANGIIICAWGNHGRYRDRAKYVRARIAWCQLHIVGMNSTGEPRFPLYLPKNTKPSRWLGDDG